MNEQRKKQIAKARKKYNEKIKRLGVKSLGVTSTITTAKCVKCNFKFSESDEIHKYKKGSTRRFVYYHQECWDSIGY